eukprot:5171667-Alexandrium_andersonii.AAC.1
MRNQTRGAGLARQLADTQCDTCDACARTDAILSHQQASRPGHPASKQPRTAGAQFLPIAISGSRPEVVAQAGSPPCPSDATTVGSRPIGGASTAAPTRSAPIRRWRPSRPRPGRSRRGRTGTRSARGTGRPRRRSFV